MKHMNKTFPYLILLSFCSATIPCAQSSDSIISLPRNYGEKTLGTIGGPLFPNEIVFLKSTEVDKSRTIEKYSDGLVAEIQQDGTRNERKASIGFQFEAHVPSTYGQKDNRIVDGYIRNNLHLGRLKGANSSLLQSRLYQYATYYLSVGEEQKAEPLIKEFLEIRNRVHSKGQPLTNAEVQYGNALKARSNH
jgi:hypothetical protein